MKRLGLLALLLAGSAQAATWQQTPDGVVVRPDGGPVETLSLSVHGDGIVHVVGMPAL